MREVVEEAACPQLENARASLAVQRLVDLLPGAEYDCPIVVLTPANPDAARVVVEVQSDELWWVLTDDGPGTELAAEMKADCHALLASLVRAVIAGRYRHGPCSEAVRRWFRPARQLPGWSETFDTDDGPHTSAHFGRRAPPRECRFSPY